jgi:predicted CXXCH cytochrome family protein
MMKTTFKLLTGIALVSLFSIGSVNAQMTGTGHDLSTNPGTKGGDQGLCRYCHAPHNTATVAPLWDRGAPDTVSFTVYDSVTMENTMGQPTGVSAGCLSCHDGITAFDALGGAAGTAGNDMDNLYSGSAAILGADLSNDHPIGVSVTAALEMETPDVDGFVNGVPTYTVDNNVECASCHDPHLVTYGSYLRLDPAGGALCEACHTK